MLLQKASEIATFVCTTGHRLFNTPLMHDPTHYLCMFAGLLMRRVFAMTGRRPALSCMVLSLMLATSLCVCAMYLVSLTTSSSLPTGHHTLTDLFA